MKKAFLILALSLFIIACVASSENKGHYKLNGTVSLVFPQNMVAPGSLIVIEDGKQNYWMYETEDDMGLDTGDKVTMIMDRHNTREIEDDEILEILKNN